MRCYPEHMISRIKSDALFAEALNYIPGGVNSPVRAFRAVGGKPFFVNRASGCRVWDVDGNEYIDYVGTWGPAILGHAQPKVIAAIKAAADHGTAHDPLFQPLARHTDQHQRSLHRFVADGNRQHHAHGADGGAQAGTDEGNPAARLMKR